MIYKIVLLLSFIFCGCVFTIEQDDRDGISQLNDDFGLGWDSGALTCNEIATESEIICEGEDLVGMYGWWLKILFLIHKVFF